MMAMQKAYTWKSFEGALILESVFCTPFPKICISFKSPFGSVVVYCSILYK
jgi:hypothetical protein